jgi:hypothetical protein
VKITTSSYHYRVHSHPEEIVDETLSIETEVSSESSRLEPAESKSRAGSFYRKSDSKTQTGIGVASLLAQEMEVHFLPCLA